MRIRQRGIEFEAIEVPAKGQPVINPPEWFVRALTSGKVRSTGNDCMDVFYTQADGTVFGPWKRHGAQGDMCVLLKDGSIVFADEDFIGAFYDVFDTPV